MQGNSLIIFSVCSFVSPFRKILYLVVINQFLQPTRMKTRQVIVIVIMKLYHLLPHSILIKLPVFLPGPR